MVSWASWSGRPRAGRGRSSRNQGERSFHSCQATPSSRRSGLPEQHGFQSFWLTSLQLARLLSQQQGRSVQLPLGPSYHAQVPDCSWRPATLLENAGPPDRRDIAREAHMARSLARLLAQGKTVMWVGGMAPLDQDRRTNHLGQHQRCQRRSDDSFGLQKDAHRSIRALPNDGAIALACRPLRTRPECLRRTCGDAAPLFGGNERSVQETSTLVLTARSDDLLGTIDEPEPSAPIDVARTLQYARNLAAVGDLRERPTFGELLTAAVATIGPKYAGSVYELAMNERASALALEHDALEWDVVDGRERYRCGDQIIDSRPWWAPKGGLLLSEMEIRRRARDEFYRDLPPAEDDKATYWMCSPNDEDDYISFVEYVLRRASLTDPEEAKSVPFQIGLRDGLDVRATLRNWAEGTIYVREEQRGHLNFRNGAIDWINASEHSDHLTGKVRGGWIDPISRGLEAALAQPEDTMFYRMIRGFSATTGTSPSSRWISRRRIPLS